MVFHLVLEVVEPPGRVFDAAVGGIRLFGPQLLLCLLSFRRLPLDLLLVIDGQLAMVFWR